MTQPRRLTTLLLILAIGPTAFAQPSGPPGGPPQQGDPEHGSITAESLSYANSTLSASVTYNAIVPEDDATGSWFHSEFYVSGGTYMTATGANEFLAPNQSATWTLQNSYQNPPTGHHILIAFLGRNPGILEDPPDPELGAWLDVDSKADLFFDGPEE